MDRKVGIFVDGMGASAASSGVLNALQGRIFALLYLEPEPLSLEDIATRLGQSKSNISINIRGLTDWHLIRRAHVPGSRRDHYEAATDLVRVMQEIIERRFRWNMRQVLATIQETRSVAAEETRSASTRDTSADAAFIERRLAALETFFRIMDATAGMLAPGRPFPPQLTTAAPATTPASPPAANQTAAANTKPATGTKPASRRSKS